MGLDVVVRVHARGQRDDPDRQAFLAEQGKGPAHGLGPCRVAVENQDHPGDHTFQQAHLLPGEGCPQGGHHGRYAVFPQGQQIEVAFHQQGQVLLAQSLPGLGQAVQQAALGIKRAFRGIEVLGFPVADDAAAEGHHPFLPVENGKHDPVPEAVVKTARSPGGQQPHFRRSLHGKTLVLEMAPQTVPSRGRIAQAIGPDDLRSEAPVGQIIPGRAAFVPLERGLVKGQGLLVQVVKNLALFGPAGFFRPQVPQGQGDAVAPGQLHGRLGKGQAVVLHDKGNDVAAGPAAETVENAFIRRHGEGGLGVGMEGAQAQQIFPLALQLDVLPHHLVDGGGVPDFLELVVGDIGHLKAGFRFAVFGFRCRFHLFVGRRPRPPSFMNVQLFVGWAPPTIISLVPKLLLGNALPAKLLLGYPAWHLIPSSPPTSPRDSRPHARP